MYWRGRRLQKAVLKELIITDWTTLGWQILDVPGPRILKHAAQSNANCEFQCSGAGRGGYPPECYSGASPFQHRSILKSFEGRLILQTFIHLLTKDKRQREREINIIQGTHKITNSFDVWRRFELGRNECQAVLLNFKSHWHLLVTSWIINEKRHIGIQILGR